MSSMCNPKCIEKSSRILTNYEQNEIHNNRLFRQFNSENSSEYKDYLIKNAHLIAKDNYLRAREGVNCNYFRCKSSK